MKGDFFNFVSDNHSGPLNPPIIPPVGKIIDVLVETVSSPTNFWIRPEDSYNAWVELIEEMDEFYSEQVSNLQPVKPEDIMVGASFAFYYEDVELWQRVTINNKISSESVALFLVDFGKIITADTSLLCYLAPQFRKLPATAIKSKLHDIRPTFGDWTPEDNLRFQELCEPNKVFKCRVEEATPDLIKDREDVRLSVRLLDTHDPAKDIDLATLLVVEGRAKMNEE
ncbi:tudor domain-containing protein 5-like [Diaphorina citri]|uniref:Tudor domain-containing protein 5-like n=1 Tax=Diaphorina citri TaxID=121845 RepID=A0A3Q0IJN1_DIACI|nr:tudor domain-containing protein 5-like [Diaphorina citri]